MEEHSESIEEVVVEAAGMGVEQPEQSDLSMEWRLTYSRAARNEPDTRETIYEDDGTGKYIFRDSSQSGSRYFFDLEDDDYNARTDWTIPIRQTGFIKFGGLVRDRTRAFDVRKFRFQPSDNVDSSVDLSSPPETLFQTDNIAPRIFELRESTRRSDNYNADHRVYSGYMMLDLPLSRKWQVMTGLRWEYSNQVLTAFDPFSTVVLDDHKANLKTSDGLP